MEKSFSFMNSPIFRIHWNCIWILVPCSGCPSRARMWTPRSEVYEQATLVTRFGSCCPLIISNNGELIIPTLHSVLRNGWHRKRKLCVSPPPPCSELKYDMSCHDSTFTGSLNRLHIFFFRYRLSNRRGLQCLSALPFRVLQLRIRIREKHCPATLLWMWVGSIWKILTNHTNWISNVSFFF